MIGRKRIVNKRSFKNFKPAEFLSALSKLSWWSVYSSEDVDSALCEFNTKVTKILDEFAPVKSFQVRNNYVPWLSKQTLDIMKERNTAQHRAAMTGLDEDWQFYRQLRNQVNRLVKTEKSQWRTNRLNSVGQDSGLVWRNLKNWFGWNRQGPPTKLLSGGNIFTKPHELANIMNKFFTSKIQAHVSNLSPAHSDPVDPIIKIMESKNCRLSLTPVHPDQVFEIISSVKTSSSCGLDNINVKILKLGINHLLPSITHIINLSIASQTFPVDWKTAKVIPLHKKKDVSHPENYRPVSLLSSVSKVCEKAIFIQLVTYFESNNLIHPSHHGFRADHNTTTALIEMADRWVESFDEGKLSAVVALDMSAAFDLVDRNILKEKLLAYNLDLSMVNWIDSYLTGRKQRVYIDGVLSEELPVDVGVPQGSILGPLIYVIYTSDLPQAIHSTHLGRETGPGGECLDCGFLSCYADDSTYTVSSDNPIHISEQITAKYGELATYMRNNRLVLNTDKTHVLVMASAFKHRKHGNFNISLNTGNEIIHPIESEYLLGANLSNNFQWNQHVRDGDTSLVKTLSKKNTALGKIARIADFKTRKMIGSGLIMSTLSYIIQVYGGCSNYLINMLQVQQNTAARHITKLPWMTSTKTLLTQCNWLSVRQLIEYHSLILFHKALVTEKPDYIYKKIKTRARETRTADYLTVVETRNLKTATASKSFIPRTIISWNSLPLAIREIRLKHQFKTELRAFIKENIPVK